MSSNVLGFLLLDAISTSRYSFKKVGSLKIQIQFFILFSVQLTHCSTKVVYFFLGPCSVLYISRILLLDNVYLKFQGHGKL